MNEEQNNNQNDPTESVSQVRVDSCTDCKKNPCNCSNKHDGSDNETVNKEKVPPKTKPPKISWI